MAATARKTNWFAIWVSVAVVVVLVVVGALVVWMNNSASTPDPVVTPDSAVINPDTGAIAVGDGDQTHGHLHRLHVPGLQPVRAGVRRGDPGPRRPTARSP